MKTRDAVFVLVVLLASACSDDSGGADSSVSDSGPSIDGQRDGPPTGPPPAIDGDFDDWQGIPTLATDPAGDGSGGFDITVLQATSRGTTLYLSFDVGQTLNASSGPAAQGSLLLEITRGSRSLTVDLRQRRVYLDRDLTRALRWKEIDYGLAPTHASDRFEVRLDVARIGAKQGDEVTIDFAGSDSLPAPASLHLASPAHAPTLGPTDRPVGTSLRLASLNTQVDGLADPTRGPALGRLLRGVAADVYCFQEVYDGGAPSIEAGLESLDPHGDGGDWTAHRFSDSVVVTRGTLTALPGLPGQRFAGAAIELSGNRVVVFGLRSTCCGHTGSSEDLQRIAEMKLLVTAIGELRDGKLGAALDPFRQSPVIVVGDWNMVGSRTPLDLLEDPAGPDLSNWLLQHLLGQDVYTWDNDTLGAFPPGKLDLLAHSTVGLQRKGGFVLDSRELDSSTLSRLGLEQDDSTASDHLMLVADFAVK